MLNKKPTKKQLLYQRYVLVGAAIGLYFGIFFRPEREPSFVTAFILSLMATAVTLLIRAFQKKPLFSLRRIGVIYILYTLMILSFEARHLAFDYAGRFGVIAFGVLVGGIVGYGYGWHKLSRAPDEGSR